MRTPTVMIIGMVLAPCGLVLNLTSTVAPAWRTLASLQNRPSDVSINQGIWDVCSESSTNQNKQCGLTDDTYFSQQVVQVARGLMIASLVVNGLGIALASWGVRCWEEEPNFLISGFGGLVIFSSGILSLVPISWYNYLMYNMTSTTAVGQQFTYAGYALVLGYLGSCLEIIGGFCLMLCFVPVCKKCIQTRRKTTSSMYYSNKEKPKSNVFSVHDPDYPPSKIGYSIGNDNYQHNKRASSVVSSPRSYTNPMDVTAGEHPRSSGGPGSTTGEHPRSYGGPGSTSGEHPRSYGGPGSTAGWNHRSHGSTAGGQPRSHGSTAGGHPRSYGRPESQLSSLPCDSDLL